MKKVFDENQSNHGWKGFKNLVSKKMANTFGPAPKEAISDLKAAEKAAFERRKKTPRPGRRWIWISKLSHEKEAERVKHVTDAFTPTIRDGVIDHGKRDIAGGAAPGAYIISVFGRIGSIPYKRIVDAEKAKRRNDAALAASKQNKTGKPILV